MRQLRTSIRGLMTFVALAALACAAIGTLRGQPVEFWHGALAVLGAELFTVATVGAFRLRGYRRALCAGLVLAGLAAFFAWPLVRPSLESLRWPGLIREFVVPRHVGTITETFTGRIGGFILAENSGEYLGIGRIVASLIVAAAGAIIAPAGLRAWARWGKLTGRARARGGTESRGGEA